VTLFAVAILGSPRCASSSVRLDVRGLRRAQKRRGAVLVQPLHREDRARLGAVFRARVHVRPAGEQRLDEIEVIEVAGAHRIVAAFDIAVVGGQIERSPAAFVGEIGIGAAFEQERGEDVVAVLGRGQQGRPSV
jgi:hypothetical protein